MNPSNWFQREFAPGIPLSMYPNLVERLRGTPSRLEDRLRGLPRELLVARRNDKWSIQEHAGHLLDLGALDLSRLDDFEAGADILRVADLTNRRTYEANHNAEAIDNILSSLRHERGEFVRRLEGYDDVFIRRQALHPRLLQLMSVVDLMFFIAEHDDHHLAKITELLSSGESNL
jgi:hypothetical protein